VQQRAVQQRRTDKGKNMSRGLLLIIAFLTSLPTFALVAVVLSPQAYHGAGMQAEADQLTQQQLTPQQTADASGMAADQALKASMAKMHQGMMIKDSGNADVDFVKSMIPHHQGAIDMAKVELQYGKDPAMKKLAQDIVDAQQAEIGTMQDWLKKQGQ
jgi:uncharacterized protein (DUF305 family)